jgi:HEPN domain-containing protein
MSKRAENLDRNLERYMARDFNRWESCDPNAMAQQSQAAIEYALADATHDIRLLRAKLHQLCDKVETTIEDCAAVAETEEQGTDYQWVSESCFDRLTKRIARRIRSLATL